MLLMTHCLWTLAGAPLMCEHMPGMCGPSSANSPGAVGQPGMPSETCLNHHPPNSHLRTEHVTIIPHSYLYTYMYM